jgi:hypothetical protein
MGRKDKKMIWHKWQKWQKIGKFMPLMPFMPVQIFIQAAKMKEEIFLSVQNDQK